MKELRKAICFIVALTMVLAIGLSACSTAKQENEGKDEITTGTTVAETEKDTGPVTLIWYHPATKQQDEEFVFDEFNKKLVDKINAKVDFRIYDYGSYDEKMNMVIAAGETFDLCFTSAGWLNKFPQNVAKGAYMALDELIEKNAPAIKTALPGFLLDYAKVKGKVYAIPNYQALAAQWGLCAPKDLLDKYGFDLKSVTKLQDLEPFLKTIKEKEPGLFPYRAHYMPVANKYEGVGVTSELCIKQDDQTRKVLNYLDTPEYNEWVTLMYDWFQKGYIRKDIASVTNDVPDWDNQKYAVGSTNIVPGVDATFKAKFNSDWVFQPLDPALLYSVAGLGTATAVSVTSENPDKAIKLIEIMNTDKEMYNLKCFGIENRHYKKVSENQIEQLENTKYKPNTSWMFGNQFNAYFLTGQSTTLWDDTIKFNESAKKSVIPGFVFNSDSVKSEVSNVGAVEKEYDLLLKGKGGLDPVKYLPEFKEKLKAAGIDKIMEEAQKQIDAFFVK